MLNIPFLITILNLHGQQISLLIHLFQILLHLDSSHFTFYSGCNSPFNFIFFLLFHLGLLIQFRPGIKMLMLFNNILMPKLRSLKPFKIPIFFNFVWIVFFYQFLGSNLRIIFHLFRIKTSIIISILFQDYINGVIFIFIVNVVVMPLL